MDNSPQDVLGHGLAPPQNSGDSRKERWPENLARHGVGFVR